MVQKRVLLEREERNAVFRMPRDHSKAFAVGDR
jgi:hypothetical protein